MVDDDPADILITGVYLPSRGFLGYWTYPFYAGGANPNITILMSALCKVLDAEKKLPPVLMLQLDNCSKDNKNNVSVTLHVLTCSGS